MAKFNKNKFTEILNDSRFKARMAKIAAVPVDRRYDIPYLAGYSTDAKVIYFDRHLKTNMSGKDLTKFLKIHEYSEKAIIDIFNIDYQKAHHIATYIEKQAVENNGINWNQYSKYLESYIKKVSKEHLKKVPKNLDVTPYKDEHDIKLLKSLMVNGVKHISIRESLGLTETKISLEYHSELNPKLWDDFKLKPEIRQKLLQFADTWAEFAKIPQHMIEDIIMIGGNANYNYTPKSDIDVHIIIDRYKLSGSRELIDEYLQDKKVLWTLTHNIKILGYSIEPYAQDSHASYPHNQGVYSLKNDTWIQMPNKGDYDFKNDPALKKKVLFYVRLVNDMIKNKMDLDAFKDLKRKFYEMRGASIAKGGEFSFENLVFKELRNRGVFDKMNKYEKTIKDQELSL